MFSAYVGRLSSLRGEFGDAVVNTVERPYLEFSAPRAIFLNTDASNLGRILEHSSTETLGFLGGAPAGVLAQRRNCTELIWAGFVADRGGDLATATRLSRRAYDLCPELGFVRHFAAHTLQVFSSSIRESEPAKALGFLRQAAELDPYTPEIAAAVAELEASGARE